jgi:hypothetical protein
MNRWRKMLFVAPAVGLVLAAAVWNGVAGAATPATAALPQGAGTICTGAAGDALVRSLAAPSPATHRWCLSVGTPSPLGDGTLRTFSLTDGDRPLSIGLVFPVSTLSHLPTTATDGHHCYDVNGDGVTNPDDMTECAGGHERPLDLPPALRGAAGAPLTWALVNYNPHGHGPPGVFTFPHFDIHFYLQSRAERDAIRTGTCGMLTNCADFATATRPIPAPYLPEDYADVGAVEVAMGNHLLDLTGPEFHGQPFTHTFVYGGYDARISFLEPMVTIDWLRQVAGGAQPNRCYPVKQPAAWQVPGWYAQRYCVRYVRPVGLTVSLEGLAHRG